MKYKITTFMYLIDKELGVQRREYVTLRRGLTWQEAKEMRGKKTMIAPEVIHEYESSDQPAATT